jgi:hypothetical protein
MTRAPLRPIPLLVLLLLALPGCAPRTTYHWGEYEDSLYKREKDTSEAGQARAFQMLEATIRDAEARKGRVPPGVYADYGYLLFRQGKTDEAVGFFRKEAETYAESRYLMEAIISRIEGKKAP